MKRRGDDTFKLLIARNAAGEPKEWAQLWTYDSFTLAFRHARFFNLHGLHTRVIDSQNECTSQLRGHPDQIESITDIDQYIGELATILS